jgi:hypothetical protein
MEILRTIQIIVFYNYLLKKIAILIHPAFWNFRNKNIIVLF